MRVTWELKFFVFHLVALFSYPQLSESYIYINRSGMLLEFLFEGIVNRLQVNWNELEENLQSFQTCCANGLRSDKQDMDAGCIGLTRILQPLYVHGLKGVNIFDL